jgi:hypothetical protein
MTIADLDEVTFDLEVDGEQVRKQLSRRTWERGGWATVACVYEERTSSGEWKRKVALVRFRREHDAWKRQAGITLSSDEAAELATFLATPEA